MPHPAAFVEFWGPNAWKFLHSIAFTYPERPSAEQRKAAAEFFRSLPHLLPCSTCGDHYGAYLRKHPVDTSSRLGLARWLYDLHQDVNRRTGKPGLSWEEVVFEYTVYPKPGRGSETLRSMADPHLGRTPGSGEESGGMERVAVLAGSGLLAVVLFFTLYRRLKSQNAALKNQGPADDDDESK